jgi:hypothetical protein
MVDECSELAATHDLQLVRFNHEGEDLLSSDTSANEAGSTVGGINKELGGGVIPEVDGRLRAASTNTRMSLSQGIVAVRVVRRGYAL